MDGMLTKLFNFRRDDGALMDYDEAKRLAGNDKPGVRRKLAKRGDVQPEILYFLAEDSAPEVRREIAANASTPVQADLLLARDNDDEVRCHVATKISSLAPTLTDEEQARVGDLVTEILQTLAGDQVSRVRRILAEELKDTADVSPAVIERLARDDDLSVAGPVLENSPLLSDEILLEIIESPTVQGALSAISNRQGLDETLSDAIVRTSDEDAVTALLANSSAQIREETLDDLVDRSESVSAWHAPLIARPTLSSRAIRGLAEFVTDNLLDKLEKREDIAPELARSLSSVVRDRLDTDPDSDRPSKDGGPSDRERAQALLANGSLDEAAVNAALDMAAPDDIVALLYSDHDKVWDMLGARSADAR